MIAVNEQDRKLKLLLARLGSRNTDVRETAKREAQALLPKDLAVLIGLEAARNDRWQVRACVGTLLALVLIQVPLVVVLKWFGIHLGGGLGGLIGPFAVLCFGYLNWGQMPRARRCLKEIVEMTEDAGYVTAALSLAHTGSVAVRLSVNILLLRLLPQVRKDETDAWTSDQRKALLVPLVMPITNVDLTLCILKSLEQIGGDWALPAVRKLANMKTEVAVWDKIPRMSTEEQLRRRMMIREAAETCLPFLEMRVEEKRQAETLLRASDSATSPEMLLRPMETSAAETPPDQLLRAKSGD